MFLAMSLAACSTSQVVANRLCVIDPALLTEAKPLAGRERLDGVKGDPSTSRILGWWAEDRGSYEELRLDKNDLAKQARVCVEAGSK